jgi:hypothetical protein
MVATQGDSWFEEGARLFYFLPASVMDFILPMEIRPAAGACCARLRRSHGNIYAHDETSDKSVGMRYDSAPKYNDESVV